MSSSLLYLSKIFASSLSLYSTFLRHRTRFFVQYTRAEVAWRKATAREAFCTAGCQVVNSSKSLNQLETAARSIRLAKFTQVAVVGMG